MRCCIANYGCRQDFFERSHLWPSYPMCCHLWQKQQLNSVVICNCDIWNRRHLGVVQTSDSTKLPRSYVLVADYTKVIVSHQFQGDIWNSGCLFAHCLKHLSENAEKAMSGIKGRGDIAACIYKMGRARTKQEYECTLQDFQALHLEAAEWFDKRHSLLQTKFLWELMQPVWCNSQ